MGNFAGRLFGTCAAILCGTDGHEEDEEAPPPWYIKGWKAIVKQIDQAMPLFVANMPFPAQFLSAMIVLFAWAIAFFYTLDLNYTKCSTENNCVVETINLAPVKGATCEQLAVSNFNFAGSCISVAMPNDADQMSRLIKGIELTFEDTGKYLHPELRTSIARHREIVKTVQLNGRQLTDPNPDKVREFFKKNFMGISDWTRRENVANMTDATAIAMGLKAFHSYVTIGCVMYSAGLQQNLITEREYVEETPEALKASSIFAPPIDANVDDVEGAPEDDDDALLAFGLNDPNIPDDYNPFGDLGGGGDGYELSYNDDGYDAGNFDGLGTYDTYGDNYGGAYGDSYGDSYNAGGASGSGKPGNSGNGGSSGKPGSSGDGASSGNPGSSGGGPGDGGSNGPGDGSGNGGGTTASSDATEAADATESPETTEAGGDESTAGADGTTTPEPTTARRRQQRKRRLQEKRRRALKQKETTTAKPHEIFPVKKFGESLLQSFKVCGCSVSCPMMKNGNILNSRVTGTMDVSLSEADSLNGLDVMDLLLPLRYVKNASVVRDNKDRTKMEAVAEFVFANENSSDVLHCSTSVFTRTPSQYNGNFWRCEQEKNNITKLSETMAFAGFAMFCAIIGVSVLFFPVGFRKSKDQPKEEEYTVENSAFETKKAEPFAEHVSNSEDLTRLKEELAENDKKLEESEKKIEDLQQTLVKVLGKVKELETGEKFVRGEGSILNSLWF
eukprot:m.25912 g.25912  ORF g.25912 m.25912 type:complete len:729 (-) comp7749_c0_seq2:138-2324(-)